MICHMRPALFAVCIRFSGGSGSLCAAAGSVLPDRKNLAPAAGKLVCSGRKCAAGPKEPGARGREACVLQPEVCCRIGRTWRPRQGSLCAAAGMLSWSRKYLTAAARKHLYRRCGHETVYSVKCGHSLVQEFAVFYMCLLLISENILV